MNRLCVCISIVLSYNCAHAPRQPAGQSVNEQIVAKALWWAIGVPEPAGKYEVRLPAGVDQARVLEMAAQYANLVVAGPGTLHRPAGDTSAAVVHLAIDTPQRVTEEEVLISFSYAFGESDATPCVVRIRTPSPHPDSWMYRSEGFRPAGRARLRGHRQGGSRVQRAVEEDAPDER